MRKIKRKEKKMLDIVVGIVGIIVTVISTIVTIISIVQSTTKDKHQKNNPPHTKGIMVVFLIKNY